ncbi:MAG: phage major capsid protein [Clostridia bacterium]|nr:phage major capsid protein [Clostridia bacterium]
MNKRMRELMSAIQGKTVEARKLMSGENKNVEQANTLIDEVASLQKEYETEEKLFNAEKTAAGKSADEGLKEKTENDSVSKFAKAVKDMALHKDMSEGFNTDGGYTVPEDIQTKINTYREAKTSLRTYVRIEPVTAPTGARTFKKRKQQTGFAKVGEKGKITGSATPQFERIEYSIEKYAGYFPVTNELLDDSDANIANVLIEWIGDESRVTANKLILATIQAQTEVKLTGVDDIKKALNVTLGQAFKPTASIFTNDDGLQYLDTLKDTDGKYLLQPDPANPMAMRLCAGASTIPIVVIPNSDMPTKEAKIPFIIGDLYEGVTLFDKNQLSIATSNIAAIGDLNAFEEDLTIFRAIEREQVKLRDATAFVNGYIETAGE